MNVLFSVLPLLLFSCLASAHGPTPQKAKQSEVINASVDQVWAVLADFDRIAEWHPGVSESKGDSKNEAGSIRTIKLAKGGQLSESLDYYSATDREYNYRLESEDVKAFPVSFYTASIQVVAEGDKARVNWKSRFYRGDTGNFPSEAQNDASAVKAMNEFITQGIQGLKERFQ